MENITKTSKKIQNGSVIGKTVKSAKMELLATKEKFIFQYVFHLSRYNL